MNLTDKITRETDRYEAETVDLERSVLRSFSRCNHTLLVIEDSKADLYLIKMELEKIDGLTFEVEEASTLREAEEFLNERRPDAILLDMKLPDGFGAQSVVRLMPYGVPIVVNTGINEPSVCTAAIDAGAFGGLVKDYYNGFTLPTLLYAAIKNHERMQS